MKQATSLVGLCVLGLLALGLVMLYSLSPLQDNLKIVTHQLVAAGIGLVAAIVMAMIDYRRLRAWSWVLGLAAVALLVAVLIPGVGYKANGARRWFRLGSFQCQPSDFAKVALLVGLAHYGAWGEARMRTFRRGVVYPALAIGPVLVLLFAEPDWGTALLLGAVSAVVLLVAGVRWSYLLPPALLAAAFIGVLLAMNPMRSDRVHSWLHLEETKDAVGYQAWQARLALGVGGVTGVGLDHSRQKRFVPEHRTDFIYAIIGEEFGLAGSAAVLTAFLVFFICGLFIASRAPDRFGLLLGTGISFLIGLQALINIGVVTGALPNKGLALPFVSYGGTNLIVMLFCTGILISIARVGVEDPARESFAQNLPGLPITRLA
jgi:cell division protein FtsW